MQNAATQAYGRTQRATAQPRDLEADLLIKAASKLQSVCEDWSNPAADLDAALTYNRRLWVVFASSVTRPENPLPAAVKQNIANLALFVFNRTVSVQAQPEPAKLSSLISINREIAAGLRGNG